MDWNAQLYDGKHRFVSEYGQDVVTLLAPTAGERILDVGCGTGDLANTLSEKGIEAVGVDQSPSMIEKAAHKYPHIPFTVRDARDLGYKNEFDAVFSNAAIHWIKPPNKVLSSIYSSLKPGGRFVAEFGGKGNVAFISRAIINQIKNYNAESFPWYFPSIGEYTALMEQAGFHVTFAEHFERPTRLDGESGMRNWITMFGDVVMGEQSEIDKERIIGGAEKELKETFFHGDHWTADYCRIRVVGVKK
ncbi:class I SAM-dependent methyltransferase [Domibacillus epiphyticus]|uniref:SAM-dependent methyltransferase n=1 Tax=Domibacillus epiphyticus TaxID=1714355 RepID=A0A1V2ABM4_9BACI|nr:class I SAM-dependent methyltransferase [Domibacillus epiphyticus]OMP68398.1 SAM-dependent methyltransferase [Domibacillus epiphyticus]